jgi:hypothetical protein
VFSKDPKIEIMVNDRWATWSTKSYNVGGGIIIIGDWEQLRREVNSGNAMGFYGNLGHYDILKRVVLNLEETMVEDQEIQGAQGPSPQREHSHFSNIELGLENGVGDQNVESIAGSGRSVGVCMVRNWTWGTRKGFGFGELS